MLLVIQIALGIVLGFLIIQNLNLVLRLLVVAFYLTVLIAILGGLAYFAIEYTSNFISLVIFLIIIYGLTLLDNPEKQKLEEHTALRKEIRQKAILKKSGYYNIHNKGWNFIAFLTLIACIGCLVGAFFHNDPIFSLTYTLVPLFFVVILFYVFLVMFKIYAGFILYRRTIKRYKRIKSWL